MWLHMQAECSERTFFVSITYQIIEITTQEAESPQTLTTHITTPSNGHAILFPACTDLTIRVISFPMSKIYSGTFMCDVFMVLQTQSHYF